MSAQPVVGCPVCDTPMQERGHADCWYCPDCDARYRFEETLLTIDGKPNFVWVLLFPESCPLCKDVMHVAVTHENVDIWKCVTCDEAFTDAELYRREAIHVVL